MSDTDVIKGAEATMVHGEYLGRKTLIKTRPAKTYRHADLDQHIRSSRTRNEVRIIHEARIAGVRTPCIYDVDMSEFSITMEYIEGVPVKKVLDESGDPDCTICRMIGENLAILHSNGICHGDLTTSNMILTESGELCFIDFSMGCTKAETEDMGVDLRLLERAFTSAHTDLVKQLESLMDAYYANIPEPDKIRKKVEDIKNRGRYT